MINPPKTKEDVKRIFNLALKENRWKDANWLIVKLLNKTGCIKYAIYAAEQVIEIYEKEYPEDDRPRDAINAAKHYLTNPTPHAARYANYTANEAYLAAYEAAAIYEAYAAADTACSAACSVETTRRAADAVFSAYLANKDEELLSKILHYGLRLLTERLN